MAALNEHNYRRMLVQVIANANTDGNEPSRFPGDVELVLTMFGALLQCLLVFLVFYMATKVIDLFLQPEEECEDEEEAAALRLIRVVSYTIDEPPPNEQEACSICLEEYGDGEELRIMPRCKHAFHRECIDHWLIRRSSFCPICRHRVIQRSEERRIDDRQ